VKPPGVVILRALGLGDLLAVVPALRAIADALPDERRILVTTAAMAPLADHLGLAEVSVARPLGAIDSALANANLAVNLHGRGPESHQRLLALNPRNIIAFKNSEAGVAGPPWWPHEHEARRWCRLLEASGIPADPARLDIDPPNPARSPLPGSGHTLIHPGAASGSRRWPVERWAQVAGSERANGRAVAITGSTHEIVLAHQLAALARLPPTAVLAGTTDLLGLATLVSTAGRVLCTDTGVAHLATALRTPSVVLFGPVPPGEWGPPTERPWHRSLWAGRRGDPHGEAIDAGLAEITVADVQGALEHLPTSPNRPG
jgi:ADP-heptose:LPS heptosyltransferase